MSTDCPVCMLPVESSADLACGHPCCATCWGRWADDCHGRRVRATCPVCRVPSGCEPSESGVQTWGDDGPSPWDMVRFAGSFSSSDDDWDTVVQITRPRITPSMDGEITISAPLFGPGSSDWTESPILCGVSRVAAAEQLRVGGDVPCLAAGRVSTERVRELVHLWRLEPRSVEEEDEHVRQWHQLSREGLEPRSVEEDDEYVRQWRRREGLEPRSVECVREGEAPREWRHGAATRSWMRY